MIFVSDSGQTFKTAYLDGYQIGDRLLEGLVIRLDIEGGKIRATVPDAPLIDRAAVARLAEEAARPENDLTYDSAPEGGEDLALIG